MRKLLLGLLLCALPLFAAPIKIGVILPLSGNNAQVGEPQLRALKLFEKELTSTPHRHSYQLIVEDDQFTPRLTAEAVNKLLNIDHVQAIVCYGIAPGNVVAARTSQAGIPMICVNASYPKIADGKTNFLHWPPVEEEAAAFVDLLQKLHSRRVAFLTVRQPGIVSVMDKVKTLAEQRGLTVVSYDTFNPNERDFRTILARLREQNPDTFIPTALSPEIEIILRQRKEVGLDAKVAAYEVFNFLSDRKAAEGLYYVAPSIGTPAFEARLKTATGAGSDYAVAYVYDALNLLRSAYEATPTASPQAACAWLRSLKNYPAAVGLLSVDSSGIFHSPIFIYQIRNGKPVAVKLEDVK